MSPRNRFIVIGPDGITVDDKPYTPEVVKHGEEPKDPSMPYIMEDPPTHQRTRDGRFYVGQRVRLTDEGFRQAHISTRAEARAALGTTILKIEGPYCTHVVDTYGVDIAGLEHLLLTTDDIEEAP